MPINLKLVPLAKEQIIAELLCNNPFEFVLFIKTNMGEGYPGCGELCHFKVTADHVIYCWAPVQEEWHILNNTIENLLAVADATTYTLQKEET